MSGVEEPSSWSKRGRQRLGSGGPKQTLGPSKSARGRLPGFADLSSAFPLSQSDNRAPVVLLKEITE